MKGCEKLKEIISYQCEVCKRVFSNQAECMKCEEREKETRKLEVGQKLGYLIKVGGGFDSYYVLARVGKIRDRGHFYTYTIELPRTNEKGEITEWHEVDVLYGNSSLNDSIQIIKESEIRNPFEYWF